MCSYIVNNWLGNIQVHAGKSRMLTFLFGGCHPWTHRVIMWGSQLMPSMLQVILLSKNSSNQIPSTWKLKWNNTHWPGSAHHHLLLVSFLLGWTLIVWSTVCWLLCIRSLWCTILTSILWVLCLKKRYVIFKN